MEQIFVFLYPMVGLISLGGYMPQIVKLARATSADDKIALSSWYMWLVTYTISIGYGAFHLKDWLFCTTMAVGLASALVVVGLVLYNRHYRFRPQAQLAPAAE